MDVNLDALKLTFFLLYLVDHNLKTMDVTPTLAAIKNKVN